MFTSTTFPLPTGLKNRATQFFQCGFDDVSVHLSKTPAQIGALAFTNGSHIWIDPKVMGLSPFDQCQVFGHELTHIVQQRQGRVVFDGNGEDSIRDQATLEAEADRHGYWFAMGGTSELIGSNAAPKNPQAIQCLVAVAGQPIKDLTAMPHSVQMVTDLIQGGSDWLGWAADEPSTTFDFPDWISLVAGVQEGLHGADLILIPSLGLLIHPVALLSMPDLGISAMMTYLNQSSTNSVADLELENTLGRLHYVNQTQLSSVSQFLQQTNVADSPLFQAMSLGDRLPIFMAINQVPGDWALLPENQQEAARYAVDYAASPAAFADYYGYYLANLGLPDFQKLDPATRARVARERSDEIAQTLRNDMRCPAVFGIPSPQELQSQLKSWFTSGNGLGFSRISHGIAQLHRDPNIVGLTGSALQRQVDRYLSQTQDFVSKSKPVEQPYVAQDGRAFFYTFGSSEAQVVLQLEFDSGCITLAANNSRQTDSQTDGVTNSQTPSESPTPTQ